jgi:tRNA A37 threonylcarbamoyladenosine dehydratase
MNEQLAVNEIMGMINSFLPKNYQIQDILNGYKAALREEIKDELRREIINELVSKG